MKTTGRVGLPFIAIAVLGLLLGACDEDEPMGKVVYLVNLDPIVSTSKLSAEILSADRDNIDSVEWEQKDSKTYIYK